MSVVGKDSKDRILEYSMNDCTSGNVLTKPPLKALKVSVLCLVYISKGKAINKFPEAVENLGPIYSSQP